jgi:hypothetical protein
MSNFPFLNNSTIDEFFPMIKYRIHEVMRENEILRLFNIEKDRKIKNLEKNS